ncbi:MAG TPA: 6-carboxytetrahydropterin synthase QueD [Syntrophorhabdaceae bacterium]|mgnify:FL=1|nr:6-carboxytetrahydropterin synthase QueD [Syntrophorhabdaceae bacterium]
MFTLCVKDSFAAAHRLVGYKDKCEELHGHNFAVEVYLSGDRLGDDGMLVDFKTIKANIQKVLDVLDHKYINDIPFFAERASSAEYVAMYIFTEMEKLMGTERVSVSRVTVWESEKACASYER